MQALDNSKRHTVLDILSAVSDLTLATVRPDGYPQATTVSYAHDGLTLYVGIGIDGQKAHNIRQNNKVSATVTPPYSDWQHIKGLSLGGIAEFIRDPDELAHASERMLLRFPQIKTMMSGTRVLQWEGAVFIRIAPQVISLLDYEQGFGHTELFAVPPAFISAAASST
jgi:general stress protein 26